MQYDNGISIVIPCFNAEHTINRCLESIPERNEIEVIIVDDCSTDSTSNVVDSFINKSSLNISFFHNANNMGAGNTRNEGIKHCSKKYMMFLDSDDALASSFVESVFHILDLGYDEIIFNAKRIFEKKEVLLKMFFSNKIYEGKINSKDALVYIRGCTCGKIYRTDMVQLNKIKFGSMPRNEDMVFTKIATSYAESVYYIDSPLYLYYDNSESLMNNVNLTASANSMNAFSIVYKALKDRQLQKELNSIYFIEVLYSATNSNIYTQISPKEVRNKYNILRKKYRFFDPYRKKYNLLYRLAFVFFEMRLFSSYKKIRQFLKKKQRG